MKTKNQFNQKIFTSALPKRILPNQNHGDQIYRRKPNRLDQDTRMIITNLNNRNEAGNNLKFNELKLKINNLNYYDHEKQKT